jgi:hypothetical protein
MIVSIGLAAVEQQLYDNAYLALREQPIVRTIPVRSPGHEPPGDD